MKINASIRRILEQWEGSRIQKVTPVPGGCISDAMRVVFNSGTIVFVKTGNSSDLFLKEANGLKELAKAKAIRIPELFFQKKKLLVLEWIESKSTKTDLFFERFGKQFAQLHLHYNTHYGFYEDNYLGETPQKNTGESSLLKDWVAFFHQNRLLYQIRLAEKNGCATAELLSTFNKLEAKLELILKGSEEKPCLIHGDLWSGNFMVDEKEQPVLIDPAVYYGHREADLAMTSLFSGFSPVFYRSYQEYYPLLPGYKEREAIYQFYHILNHLNLFGMSYYDQAIRLARTYL